MGNEIYAGYTRVSAILDTYQPQGLIDWKIKTDKEGVISSIKKIIYSFFEEKNLPVENLQDYISSKLKGIKSLSKKISKTATDIGSDVDAWIRADIEGKKYPKLNSIEVENCVKAYQKWVEDYQVDVKTLKSGSRLFNGTTKICGEPDILDPNESMVIDIKCSSAIRQTYWLQTEWYGRELGYTSKAVLRLDKNLAIYEYECRPLSEIDKSVFDALVVVHNYFKPSQREDNEEEA